eukprot:TRINITY_DN26554_c0_g1_i1.p1 TRINITY_DN26554_c0_g1~~TRINITY_DN26554_c0_g1_i1.p1  ORF type:complete len:339 (+),score=70.86 TRINITY_DN26554_c0_g1_i1:119-1135(+)
MIRRPPRSTLSSSSAASDVYKRQINAEYGGLISMATHPRLQGAIIGGEHVRALLQNELRDHELQAAKRHASPLRRQWGIPPSVAHVQATYGKRVHANHAPVQSSPPSLSSPVPGGVFVKAEELHAQYNQQKRTDSGAVGHAEIAFHGLSAATAELQEPEPSPVFEQEESADLCCARDAYNADNASLVQQDCAVTFDWSIDQSLDHPCPIRDPNPHHQSVPQIHEPVVESDNLAQVKAELEQVTQDRDRLQQLVYDLSVSPSSASHSPLSSLQIRAILEQHMRSQSTSPNSPPHPPPLSLIHISEPTRLLSISYAVFCLKKKKISKQEQKSGDKNRKEM